MPRRTRCWYTDPHSAKEPPVSALYAPSPPQRSGRATLWQSALPPVQLVVAPAIPGYSAHTSAVSGSAGIHVNARRDEVYAEHIFGSDTESAPAASNPRVTRR